MKYIYQARTKEGKLETGVVEASSKEAAAILLQKYNVFATSIKEQSIKDSLLKNVKIEAKTSKKDLAVFSRQLAVMLEARVPIVQSLNSLTLQIKKTKFREAVIKIASLVEEGAPLSDACAAFPKIFDNFYVNLVKSGEASGDISESLNYLSEHLERESDIIAQIRSALIYPIFVLCTLVVVLGIIMVVVIPRVTDLIKETNAQPSLLVMTMLHFYEFLNSYWWVLIILIAVIIASTIYYFRTKEGKRTFDKLSIITPFIGEVVKKVYLVRFCESISTLLAAGISINTALGITRDTINNHIYKDIVFEAGQEVSKGEKISSVLLKHRDYFPPFVIQMIKVGEETGKLDKTLMEVVKFYNKEIKRAIDLIAVLLEPIMIIILGIIVSMLAISVLEPLYGSLSAIG